MNIPSNEAAVIAEKYDQELVLIVGYDGKVLEVASFGRRPTSKDMAADWADRIPRALDFGDTPKTTHEDFRATPEARYKAELDDLRKLVRDLARVAWGPPSSDEDVIRVQKQVFQLGVRP